MSNYYVKPLVAALCLAGSIALPAATYAASSSANAASSAQIDKVIAQTQALQAEVDNLQKQVANLKHQTKHTKKDGRQVTSKPPVASSEATTEVSAEKPPHLSKRELFRLNSQEREYLPFDLDVPGQAFVSTGPYVGVPIQYAGSHLVINSPSVNTDVQLLEIRKSIQEQLLAMGGEIYEEPYHSHLLLSGLVETQANYTDVGGAPSTSTIDVTNVSLDAFFLGPSNWLLGFIEMTYDNGPPTGGSYVVSNSRVYINKAFVTIGDFTKSPWYGTFGQFYVPFGTYSSLMVSDVVTKLLARTKARAIELGFKERGDNIFYASTYIFRGDSHAASVSKINNGGVNVGYKFVAGSVHGNVGGGVIANMADSGGMQLGTNFNSYEQISHRVPAYNLRGLLSLGSHVDLIAEYVGASTTFNVNDMSYNGRGAKPWALDTQAAYSFYILDNRPSALGIGYAKTGEALAVGLPTTRYSMVFNTSLWRNTLQSLEFRHDVNYASSSTANGPTGAASTPGACVSASCAGSGESDNAITAQFDYYF